MIYLSSWLMVGVIGWLILWFYRLWTEGAPRNLTWKSATKGYLFSLLLGPLTFVFLGLQIYWRYREH